MIARFDAQGWTREADGAIKSSTIKAYTRPPSPLFNTPTLSLNQSLFLTQPTLHSHAPSIHFTIHVNNARLEEDRPFRMSDSPDKLMALQRDHRSQDLRRPRWTKVHERRSHQSFTGYPSHSHARLASYRHRIWASPRRPMLSKHLTG